jgi:hypothetical protein
MFEKIVIVKMTKTSLNIWLTICTISFVITQCEICYCSEPSKFDKDMRRMLAFRGILFSNLCSGFAT